MPKTTISIEIEIPNGYEFVRLGQMYDTSKGEVAVNLPQIEDSLEPAFVICRPEWQWPAWLKARWIAMEQDGRWFAYSVKPKLKRECWCADNRERLGNISNPDFVSFDPPNCDDYTLSLRENPNYTQATK